MAGLVGCSKADDPPVFGRSDPYSLRVHLNEPEFIGVGELTSSDPKAFTTVIRFGRALKGTAPTTDASLNMAGVDPKRILARHLVDGSPVVVFQSAGVLVVYLNRFFVYAYGDAVTNRWGGAYMEGKSNQTFNGTARELAQVVEKALKGELWPPPLNSNLPPVDTPSLRDLPAWDADIPDARLPGPFRKIAPPPPRPRPADRPASVVPGLEWACFEGIVHFMSEETPQEKGTSSTPNSGSERGSSPLTLKFRGYLEVPKEGEYVFSERRDKDCSLELKIGDAEIDLGGALPEYLLLSAGKHAVTLTYSGAGGPGRFELFWSGPDLPKEPIPAKAWFRHP